MILLCIGGCCSLLVDGRVIGLAKVIVKFQEIDDFIVDQEGFIRDYLVCRKGQEVILVEVFCKDGGVVVVIVCFNYIVIYEFIVQLAKVVMEVLFFVEVCSNMLYIVWLI